jgi:mevalonate kinase
MTAASAPGKIILLGEHAVVYARPAIAIPLSDMRATARVDDLKDTPPSRVLLDAPDIGFSAWLHRTPASDPLGAVVRMGLTEIGPSSFRAMRIRVTSSIPPAAGMGSGTAVSVAILRALSAHLGSPLATDRLSALTYEVEKLHHGTPSGIDNTVVVYEQPMYFVRGRPLTPLTILSPLHMVIGDTGVPSPTSLAVGQVHEAWRREPERFEGLFSAIANLADAARVAIERSETSRLGELMNQNHSVLQALGVSSPAIDALTGGARAAGALGAKLSGAGLGGIVVALVTPESAAGVEDALRAAGATRTYRTLVAS